MWCKTLQANKGHQSEQLLPCPFYLFRAYKKVAKNSKFLHLRKNIVVFCCTTKEVFKTKYKSCSPILFLVLKKKFLQNFLTCFEKVSLKNIIPLKS